MAHTLYCSLCERNQRFASVFEKCDSISKGKMRTENTRKKNATRNNYRPLIPDVEQFL